MSIKISVVTATFNSAELLPALIESLKRQTDRDFEWIVVDGASTDGTLSILGSVDDMNLVIDSRPDFGIYDALNRGIKLASGTHYLVVGSDDTLLEGTIFNFKNALKSSSARFISANILSKGIICKPRGGSLIINKQMAFIAGHSVGTLIDKSTHVDYGYYSSRFPIGADQYFLEKAYLSGEIFYHANFTAGVFGESGTSSVDLVGSLVESFRIHVELTRKLWINLFVLLLRLMKHARKISKFK